MSDSGPLPGSTGLHKVPDARSIRSAAPRSPSSPRAAPARVRTRADPRPRGHVAGGLVASTLSFQACGRNSGKASMPSSAASWPRASTGAEMRAPSARSMRSHTRSDTPNVKAPMAAMPTSCTSRLPPAAMLVASVPQAPAPMWAGIAPTSSSIRSRSRAFMPSVQIPPPTAPMTAAQVCSAMFGPAAMATIPAMAPLRAASRCARPNTGRDSRVAVIAPAAAARTVLAMMLLIATASATPPSASCEPPLKPRKPQQDDEDAECHRRHVVGRGRLDRAVGAELAGAGADHENPGERRPAAGRVDDGRSREVAEAPWHPASRRPRSTRRRPGR